MLLLGASGIPADMQPLLSFDLDGGGELRVVGLRMGFGLGFRAYGVRGCSGDTSLCSVLAFLLAQAIQIGGSFSGVLPNLIEALKRCWFPRAAV